MILLSVGPGPGALAVPGIAREVSGTGHRVEVVLEPGSHRFVGPAAFAGAATVVSRPSKPPQAVLFAPATAGTLARLAHGLGDGVEYAGGAGITFVAPDLDAATAEHPAVAHNLSLLREGGVRVVAGGEGGMVAAGEVVAAVLGGLGGAMDGWRLLVTAGGTHEPMDSVRFIGNRSSGKMGVAVAREALRLGATVTVVAANVAAAEPGTHWVGVETVEEMRAEVLRLAGDADALVMAAAVSDFKPASVAQNKIRRGEGGLRLELEPTADILKAVGERNPDLFVVGFAATHGDPVPDAREKLVKKGADIIVGNDISRDGVGFGSEENEVYVVDREGELFVPRASKGEVARVILDNLIEKMNEERQR